MAKKRRSLKVSHNQKLKSGGRVDGKSSPARLDRMGRGGKDESDIQLERLGKDQKSQETEWDKYAKGGSTKKKFIKGMDLKKGAFTAQAKKAGESTHEYAEEEKHAPGKTGKRARLALTFEGMAKKK